MFALIAAMAAATRKDSPYQCAIAGAGYGESDKINIGIDRSRFGRMAIGNKLSGRDVIKDAANAEIPILIYHGDRDVRVPDTYGKAFYNAIRKYTTAKYLNVPDMPHSLPWTPDQQRLTLTEIEKYDVPGGPDDMEIRADGKELWATARFARKVQVVNLDQKKLSHSIPVGRSPHGVWRLSAM